MIRNLLNNRWFVITLALASGLLLARSLAAPFFAATDFSDVEDPEFYLDEAVEESASDNPEPAALVPGQSVLSGQLNWNEDPQRDPFRRIPPAVHPVTGVLSTAAHGGPSGLPRLDALVAGPDSLLAVLDNRIVRQGDLVAGYRVARIDRSGVLLSAAGGNHRLSVADMSRGPTIDVIEAGESGLNDSADEPLYPTEDSGF